MLHDDGGAMMMLYSMNYTTGELLFDLFVNLFQTWVVPVLWWYDGLVLLAPQTNVERPHAFDDGSDSPYMFECAGRVSWAVRHRIRPCCLCSDKICRHFFVGVYLTKQLFCKINQMLIRSLLLGMSVKIDVSVDRRVALSCWSPILSML